MRMKLALALRLRWRIARSCGMSMLCARLPWHTWPAGGRVAWWPPLAQLALPAMPAAGLTLGKPCLSASGWEGSHAAQYMRCLACAAVLLPPLALAPQCYPHLLHTMLPQPRCLHVPPSMLPAVLLASAVMG